MLDMKGNDISRRVYSKRISPCVNARSESAKIVEPKPVRIGGLFDGEVNVKQGLYGIKKKSTLDTMQGGYRQPSVIIEPKVLQIGNIVDTG